MTLLVFVPFAVGFAPGSSRLAGYVATAMCLTGMIFYWMIATNHGFVFLPWYRGSGSVTTSSSDCMHFLVGVRLFFNSDLYQSRGQL